MQRSRLKSGGPLARTSTLKSSGRLKPKSTKKAASDRELVKAYVAADDAEQCWCSVCGKPGAVEHSHHYSQHLYPQHACDARNWLQMGKRCGCHRTYENNKPLFAKKWPKVWAFIIEQMQVIDPKAYDFYNSKTPELYPD